jgi:hypothetical protein
MSPFSILEISEDHDAALGADWAIVLVGLDHECKHSWDSFGTALGALVKFLSCKEARAFIFSMLTRPPCSSQWGSSHAW